MLPVGFEPTISAGEQPQTYTLDRAATGTGIYNIYTIFFFCGAATQRGSWPPHS